MATRPQVLFVRNPDGGGHLAAALKDAGLDVVTAESARSAAAALEARTPQCVVSQYAVPPESGTETDGGATVREAVTSIDPDLPFILVSDIEHYDDAREQFDEDIFGYVPLREDTDTVKLLLRQIQSAISQLPARRRAAMQAQINEVIRQVNGTLVRARDREEIEQSVVDVLTQSHRYRWACLASVDTQAGTAAPRTGGRGGADEGWRDRDRERALTIAHQQPLVEAKQEGETIVSRLTTERTLPGEDAGTVTQMESVFAVPLDYEGSHYGVLAVYSNRASAFQTDERRALREAARNVALAIHAAEARVELRERTRALKRQHDRLEEFARVISHELRHPLQVAMGRLEIVEDVANGEDLLFDQIDTIERNHTQMEQLIDDLVALARENARQHESEPTSLPVTARRAAGMVDGPGPTLRIDTEAFVDADPERLRHLFEVVFEFAVDRAGDTATLGVERLDSDAGFAVVSTDDALPDADPEELFQMHPEPSDARRISMRIIMNIIESHDWSFDVESRGEETRFVFTNVEFI